VLFATLWFMIAGGYFGLWTGGLGTSSDTPFFGVSVVPTLIIYFFYHPVLELLMKGRTPGKRMAGIRVLTRTGELPSVGAILLRNLFRILDALPVFYAVGLMCVVFSRQHLRVGDMAAGTILVMDAIEADRSLASLGSTAAAGKLNPQALELVHDLLERWSSLEYATRRNLALALLAKIDPQATADTLAASSTTDLQARLRAAVDGGAA
jgi:uncharacterized RDD family membrane protein YckC